ncbi:MAG: histidine phosphatase family protein [Patescibacteria group bacterium]|nr:histidine phosphatase family protein [Patescibacteria group bacterium]
MKLYCVRHAESVLNPGMRVHQTADTPLSEAGIKQAHLVAKRFANIPIDGIIASDYARAKHTAEIIHATVGKTIEFSPLLRELKKPTALEGKDYDDPEIAHILIEIANNKHNPHWKYSDGESFSEFVRRGSAFLEMAGNRDEASLLIVSHGQFLNMVAALITIGQDNLTPALLDHFFHHTWMTNTGVTIFEQFEADRWCLLSWNDHSHLV